MARVHHALLHSNAAAALRPAVLAWALSEGGVTLARTLYDTLLLTATGADLPTLKAILAIEQAVESEVRRELRLAGRGAGGVRGDRRGGGVPAGPASVATTASAAKAGGLASLAADLESNMKPLLVNLWERVLRLPAATTNATLWLDCVRWWRARGDVREATIVYDRAIRALGDPSEFVEAHAVEFATGDKRARDGDGDDE